MFGHALRGDNRPTGTAGANIAVKAARPLLHSILLLTLLARSAMVPGYMPGSSGGPLALCPEGLPEVVAARLFGTTSHHHQHHGNRGEPEPTRHAGAAAAECALGTGWIALGPPPIDIAGSAPMENALPSARSRNLIPLAPRADFRARAPPHPLQHA